MIDSEEDEANVLPLGPGLHETEKLPYRVELWNVPRDELERVLARAASVVLARAIYTAAQSEYLGRYIVLRRGSKVIEATI